MVSDQLNRPLKDLRISVIDRCNLRCPYCMPKEKYGEAYQFIRKESLLGFEEIERIARIAVGLGVEKIRITGGEPLLRPDLPDLVRALNGIDKIKDLALTTNGLWLTEQVYELRQAGLRRLTVSLDSLNKEVYRHMSGGRGNIRRVLDGIREAEEAGFSSIKINVVVLKGVNDHLYMDIIHHFRGTGHIVRFIEYMDVGNLNQWSPRQVVSSKEILQEIQRYYPLIKAESNYFGEVAMRYKFLDGGGEIGFISSVSQPFCTSCTRLRLSADGKIYTCLFSRKFTDLGRMMRDGITDQDLKEVFSGLWNRRHDQYSQTRHKQEEKIPLSKAEMFHMGG